MPPGGAPMGPGGPPGSGPPGAGPPPPGAVGPPVSGAPPAQPLPSNVLGKGGDRTMDQQYMQQSSQIFVFSTQWANRGAQAVINQEFGSIVQWHEAQPDTKKQMEVSEGLELERCRRCPKNIGDREKYLKMQKKSFERLYNMHGITFLQSCYLFSFFDVLRSTVDSG